MSAKPYGPLVQNGWVVKDIDAAIKYWTETWAVGPFFKFPKIVWETGFYRGKDMIPDYDAAVAYNGEFMVELIKPNGPSIFQEALDSGNVGVQHMCAMTDDLAAATAYIEKRGGVAIQGGTFADGSALTYFDMGGRGDSHILEIAQLLEGPQQLFAAIKAAAASWDGKTPVMTL
ncbi:MAG: VOC family protein [Caulobacterales bacterium]